MVSALIEKSNVRESISNESQERSKEMKQRIEIGRQFESDLSNKEMCKLPILNESKQARGVR